MVAAFLGLISLLLAWEVATFVSVSPPPFDLSTAPQFVSYVTILSPLTSWAEVGMVTFL